MKYPILKMLLILSLLGMGAELFLIEHFEGIRQRIPLILVSTALILCLLYRPRISGRWLTILYLTSMGALVVGGFAGLYYHYAGNREFELEMYPEMQGLELIYETLKGATPALAPGALIQIGLLGFFHAYGMPHQPQT